MKKRYSKQQIAKLTKKKCFFCGEDDYAVLDAHRIVPGSVYHLDGILVSCSNCHRKTHDGQIITDSRKYTTTLGKTMIHYWKDDQEFWKLEE